MPDEPFITAVTAKQLGAGHEQDPPALEPDFCIRTVNLFQDRHDLFTPGILP